MFADDLLEVVWTAEERYVDVVDLRIFGNEADCAKTDFGFALQPVAQLRGALTRTDKERSVFAAKDPARKNRRKIIVRKEQRDVQPWHEVEQEHAGDKRVFRGDEIKHKQTDARRGLAKTEPVRPQQFVLQKEIFRAAQRFQSQSEDEHSAVTAVAAPGDRTDRG